MAAPMQRARVASWKLFSRHYRKKSTKIMHPSEDVRSIKENELPMDPTILNKIKDGEIKPRKNPGIMRLKTVVLPIRLEKAVDLLFQKYGMQGIISDSRKLNTSLMTRQMPMERAGVMERKNVIRQKILEKDKNKHGPISSDKEMEYMNEIERRVEVELKHKHLSHWKSKQYDAKSGMKYMMARMAQNYAVLLQVLNEIWTRDPTYIPKSLYNYGSGLGSVIWAAQNNPDWQRDISQYYCVDPSVDINTIARLLLQDGHEEKSMHVNGVFFKKFPPSPSTNSFSTVVSAYTLIECENKEARQKMVQSLWDMTEDYLVLVEIGSFVGHRLIQEAKEFILNISDEEETDKKASVFAPCPHDMPCPKFKLAHKVPCYFVADYKPLEKVAKKVDKTSERYTFVILKKTKEQVESVRWPRLVANSTFANKHIHCRICCPTGQLDHIIITKKKHSKELYACVKNSKLGDCLPVIYTNESTKKHQKLIKYKQLLSEGNENELGNIRDSKPQGGDPETVSSGEQDEEIIGSSEVTESVGDMEGHESDSELEEHSYSDTGNFSAKPDNILT
ncbi:methyltransferase-like protein 17, mitochondrial [Mytilus californianus]|uniref:methyltransferase-like protein 17, mitochondrial n=1 Tax=Mytilus californianus TaxID=6549 RepID=UPI0022461E22|nr:methyltransferase-like protein 17, mitochondrial [Mytilus californianus]